MWAVVFLRKNKTPGIQGLTNSFLFTFLLADINDMNLVILVNHEIGDLVKSEMKDLADKEGRFSFLNLGG